MSDEVTQTAIPDEVVHALEIVEEELREDVIDPETITTFMHLMGFDHAREWLGEHPALYFEALRRCRHHGPVPRP